MLYLKVPESAPQSAAPYPKVPEAVPQGAGLSKRSSRCAFPQNARTSKCRPADRPVIWALRITQFDDFRGFGGVRLPTRRPRWYAVPQSAGQSSRWLVRPVPQSAALLTNAGLGQRSGGSRKRAIRRPTRLGQLRQLARTRPYPGWRNRHRIGEADNPVRSAPGHRQSAPPVRRRPGRACGPLRSSKSLSRRLTCGRCTQRTISMTLRVERGGNTPWDLR